MSPSTIQVLLDSIRGVDPIAGMLQQPPDGDPEPFTGWFQLTKILEAIRCSATGS